MAQPDMKKLRNSNKAPPGGVFIYVDPGTKARIEAPSKMRLILKVQEFRKANGFEPLPERDIIAEVCKEQPHLCYDSDEPSAGRKVTSLAGELGRWIKRGFKILSKEQLEARLRVCEGCGYWGGTAGGSFVRGKCGKCGCSGVKLALATAKCPLNKWPDPQ